jgi:hypothetical protein
VVWVFGFVFCSEGGGMTGPVSELADVKEAVSGDVWVWVWLWGGGQEGAGASR